MKYAFNIKDKRIIPTNNEIKKNPLYFTISSALAAAVSGGEISDEKVRLHIAGGISPEDLVKELEQKKKATELLSVKEKTDEGDVKLFTEVPSRETLESMGIRELREVAKTFEVPFKARDSKAVVVDILVEFFESLPDPEDDEVEDEPEDDEGSGDEVENPYAETDEESDEESEG